MKRVTLLAFLIIFLLVACDTPVTPTLPPGGTTAAAPPTSTSLPTPSLESVASIMRPFPQHTAYSSSSILPNHRTQTQLDDDARAFYDYWKSEYVVEAGLSENDVMMYRIAFGKSAAAHERTVSEGQGYGMIITAIMAGYDPDAQTIFNGLWEFVRAHPSEIDPRLMDWNVPDTSGNASAFDGDADIALGLLLADAQWGSDGLINYQAGAEYVMAGILDSTIGPASYLPMLGDWVNANGRPYNQYTPRSSDFMLANFRAFGNVTNDPIWQEVILQSQAVMQVVQTHHSPETGLMPDFIVQNEGQYQPAPPAFLENTTDGAYSYNAGRIPWRVGVDALLYDDAISRTITQKISHWIEAAANNNPANIHAGYELNGSPLPDRAYFSTFFVAPMGVAAMNDPAQQTWLNAIYDAIYNTHQDYYEDSVTLLCLLILTGNFWIP